MKLCTKLYVRRLCTKLYTKLCAKLLYRASVVKLLYTEPSYTEPSCKASVYRALYKASRRPSVCDLIDVSPVQRRFLLDIVEAYRVDILIDYRAASAD